MKQENINNLKITSNYDTSKVSWLKSGGIAKFFSSVKNDIDLVKLISYLRQQNIPFLVIGNFSNTLIRTNGFKGMIIKLSGDYSKIILQNDDIIVGSSVQDKNFSIFCYENSITGYEFLYTIPGTIGGNIFMNAGCFGYEISNKIKKVRVLNTKSFEISEIDCKDINFQYRKGFQDKDFIILGCILKTKFSSKENIKKKINELDILRKQNQPQKVNCCGSIFKNPSKISAWELISTSVDKSFYNGAIKLSKKHSNFFENDAYIQPDKVENFLKLIEQKVFFKHKIQLEKELQIYGD